MKCGARMLNRKCTVSLVALLGGAGLCFGQVTSSPTSAGQAKLENGKPFAQEIMGTTVKFDMVPIPAGNGLDGKTLPAFWIGRTEVLWDMYDIFVYGLDQPSQTEGGPIPTPDGVTRPTKPYLTMDRGFGHAGYPVISVSYKGAEEFCKWLSAKTGRKYRLPTEAEWEYVALAGGKEPLADIEAIAWHQGNADAKTQPAASKKANAWGVYDMFGNAREWVAGNDGKPVTKGGSFRDKAESMTARDRVENKSAWNASDPQIPKSVWWLADGGFVGFRVVCEQDSK